MAHDAYHVCSPLCALLLLLLLQYLTLPLPSGNHFILPCCCIHTYTCILTPTSLHTSFQSPPHTYIIPSISSLTSSPHTPTSSLQILALTLSHLFSSLLLSSSAGWRCRGQPCSGREGPADGAGFKRQGPSKQGRVCVQPARLYRQCPAGTGQLRSCNSELPGRSQNHPTVVRVCR